MNQNESRLINDRLKVESDGSIWSRKEGSEVWKSLSVTMKNGKPTVIVETPAGRKRRHVSALVCEAFIGPAPTGKKPVHANGQFKDCRAANLSYGQRQKRGEIDDAMQFDLDDMTEDDKFRILELYWVRRADKISIANDMELEYRTVQFVIDNNPKLTVAQGAAP